MSKIEISQKQTQSLTQSQQLSLSFLERTSEDVEVMILEAYNENPFIEYTPQALNSDKDFFSSVLDSYIETVSLKEILYQQVLDSPYDDDDILHFLIESVDEYGYLNPDYLKVVLDIFPKASETDISKRIAILSTFEPSGVGAVNLSQCLKIQLKHDEDYDLLEHICDHLLPEVGAHEYQSIADELDISLDKLKTLIAKIKACNPRPGLKYPKEDKQTPPDIIIQTHDGIEVTLSNDFSSFHVKEIQNVGEDESLKNKLAQAKAIQYSIKRRNQTLLEVIYCIIALQEDFFANKGKLKGMSQKMIADALEIHESTVSRSLKDKVLLINSQIYPASFLFKEVLEGTMTQDDVITLIKEIIKDEPKEKPYSDLKIVEQLKAKGLNISRRTVNKYRDLAGIGDSSYRKKAKQI